MFLFLFFVFFLLNILGAFNKLTSLSFEIPFCSASILDFELAPC